MVDETMVKGDSPSEESLQRKEVDELLSRIRFESGLLVSRTASILTFNGLMATAVVIGSYLPSVVKTIIALLMMVINLIWWFRAGAAQAFIFKMEGKIWRNAKQDEIPVDERIHKEEKKGRPPWLSSTAFFSIAIPAGLVVFWLVVLCWVVLGYGLTPRGVWEGIVTFSFSCNPR